MNNIITHEPRDVAITTFGYLHAAPPEAHITLDLRTFKDPHISPELRHLTARDPKVQTAVLNTPGIPRLIDAAAAMVLAYLAGPADAGSVTVVIGCAGGRHRAATFGMELAAVLYRWGVTATLTHRDLDKDVVDREAVAPRTYTHAAVLTEGVDEGWADPETDPTRIDWKARQAAAAIPFEVVDGRPVNPFGPTGVRYGRNELGHWGEALAADALVSAVDPVGHRWLLMVERADGHGWALPGGHVDPGETPIEAAVRELAEETGLQLPNASWRAAAPRYVPDPRASDEAWMVTVLCTTQLGVVDPLPEVAGGDDAARAAWIRADDFETLVGYLDETHDDEMFAAHVDMLRGELDEDGAGR